MEFNYIPLLGLVIGVILSVLVPYGRKVLEHIAKTGKLEIIPKFDWRYLAMFLGPVAEYAIAFLTVDGLWQAVMDWRLIPAIAIAYAGADLAKQGAKGLAAFYKAIT